MLYKHYRYIMIIKIAVLLIWVAILWSQWSSPWYNGGTTIMVFENEQQFDPYTITNTVSLMPWPYSLIHREWQKITLHIPWTYDTWYILQYLRNGFPTVHQETTDTSYFKNCRVTLNVVGTQNTISQCQKYWLHGQIWAVLLILIWVIL